MDTKRRSPRNSFVSIFLLVLVFGAAVFGYYYRQIIIDNVRAYQYKPSSQVVKIRDNLALTPKGLSLFNASLPEIESSDSFNKSCNQHTETNNPILGCYANQQIYIFNITNTKLSGIEETTAAHEFLHAAYERLSPAEKTNIDQALEAAYKKVKTPELESRMQYYEQSEPGQRLNELHSILGTEFSNLGSTLESHYSKYFTNRAHIVSFHDQYSSVFESSSSTLKELESQINQKIISINQQISNYTNSKNEYETARVNYNNSESRSESERSALIAQQRMLNDARDNINNQVDQVNNLKAKYNALAKEYNQLNNSINSSLKTTPSL